MAPPQQDAGAEHPPDARQDGTTEMPDTGPEPRRAAALGRPVAQELFELEFSGDNVERRYRRMRTEVEAMPWGTFDTRGLPEAAVTLARKQWTSFAFQEHRTALACAATLRALSEAADRSAFDREGGARPGGPTRWPGRRRPRSRPRCWWTSAPGCVAPRMRIGSWG
jgi:hypothetical protein